MEIQGEGTVQDKYPQIKVKEQPLPWPSSFVSWPWCISPALSRPRGHAVQTGEYFPKYSTHNGLRFLSPKPRLSFDLISSFLSGTLRLNVTLSEVFPHFDRYIEPQKPPAFTTPT